MKKHILFSLAIGSLFMLTGCENTNVWEEEQYIKQAYLVGIGEEGSISDPQRQLCGRKCRNFRIGRHQRLIESGWGHSLYID